MKQRLGIAAALLRDRELLVLDEPTNGLDPQGTREVRRLVRDLAGEGMTVFVSSHLLSEVEQVATHVGIMSVGRLLRQGRLDEVLGTGSVRLRVETPDVQLAAATLAAQGLEPSPDGAAVTAPLGDAAVEQLAAALVGAGVRLRGLRVERPHLEELFVQMTGEGFDVRS
jgi:ABC-2 type transport system ATP-binding protein